MRSAFRLARLNGDCRNIGVVTFGAMTGPGVGVLEEIALAANSLDMRVIHFGPHNVPGMTYRPPKWHSVRGMTDEERVDIYTHALWICHMRPRDAFELTLLEALVCGVRPVVFDREQMRRWYGDHAIYVRECRGEELTAELVEVFKYDPEPVLDTERAEVFAAFGQKEDGHDTYRRRG